MLIKKCIKKIKETQNLKVNIIKIVIIQLLYKSRIKGKLFYQANEYYASSQVCSVCDNKDKIYKDLKEREYKCSKCGLEIDSI